MTRTPTAQTASDHTRVPATLVTMAMEILAIVSTAFHYHTRRKSMYAVSEVHEQSRYRQYVI